MAVKLRAEGTGQVSPFSRRTPLRTRALASSAVVLGFFGLMGITSPAAAEGEDQAIRNNGGGVGLIDMPSARMAPDGVLSAGASFLQNTQHYNFGFQALPWLETSFRYSGLQHFDPAYPVYFDRSFAAKVRFIQEGEFIPAIAVGINDVIGTGIYGGEYLVVSKQFGSLDATLGIGWGRMGDANNFRNPFTLISKSFETRTHFDAPGGTTFGNLFHGPTAGIFGGVTWNTPVDGLSLIGELSSDSYSEEHKRGNFSPSSQLNFGANYQPTQYLEIGLAWLYGKSVALNFSFAIDPVKDSYSQRLGPPPVQPPDARPLEQSREAIEVLAGKPQPRLAILESGILVDAVWSSAANISDASVRGSTLTLTIATGDVHATCARVARLTELYRAGFVNVSVTDGRMSGDCEVSPFGGAALHAVATPPTDLFHIDPVATTPITIDARGPAPPDTNGAIANIRKEAANEQITIAAIRLSKGEAVVYYAQGRYFHEKDAVDRLVRILMLYAPPQIERFRLIATAGGVPLRQFEVLRTPVERNLTQTGELEIASALSASPAPMQNPILTSAVRSTYPHFSWTVFPQFRQQLFDPTNPFGVQILAGAAASAELFQGFSLSAEAEVNIWDNFQTGRTSDSLLPHVRTDFVKYFTEGKNGVGDFEADYRFRLSPSVYAITRAGYLESMFAGAGGELLWRPEGERWALGADLYWAKQRNFDRLLGLQPYQVTTGHVSLYYSSPWYNLEFVLRAGQYLAGDRGLTLEVSRRFESGVQIGAFMTQTNVSAQQFGEGSFDKGIIIRIPLGFTIPINSQNAFNLDLRPVQRDGGQRLAGDAILYEETRRTSYAEAALGDDTAP